MSTYVFVELDIVRGKMDEFCEAMSIIIPAVEEQGWKVLFGGQEMVGQLNRVYDLYEVADANAIQEVPIKMAPVMEAKPELVAAYDTVAKVVIRERITVCDKLPYWKG